MPTVLSVLAGLLVVGFTLLGRTMGWLRRPPSPVKADLTGRVAIVTGANSGIGKITAGSLASMGAHVVLACRSVERGAAAAAELVNEDPNRSIEVLRLDLSDLTDVRRFVVDFRGRHPRLDILVNNAGRVVGEHNISAQGHELTLATNHLGPFLLTTSLLDLLEESEDGRVVTVASVAHRQGTIDLDDLQGDAREYAALTVYAASKLANVLFTRELARRVGPGSVAVNCVHPGTIRSGFAQDGDGPRWMQLLMPLARWTFMTPELGADCQTWLAAAPEARALHGAYVVRRRPGRVSKEGRDDALATGLWNATEELVTASGD